MYLIYGAVELQVHDNGPEFVNSVLSHLSRMLGIQDLRSTAYRPVANSAIERAHRTINAVFAKTINGSQRDWHEQTKYVCFAYNTARHSSTLFSPFYLVFLREPRVGIDLFLDRSEPGYQTTDEYSEKVQERMQKAYQIVSDQLRVTFDRAKRRYDQRVHAVHFPLNSYVWFFCPRLTAGRGRKFRKLTDGPFRIVRILNDVNYVIQKVPGSRLQICHVDRLIRYEGEPPAAWVQFDHENKQSTQAELLSGIPGEPPPGTLKMLGTKCKVRNSRVSSVSSGCSIKYINRLVLSLGGAALGLRSSAPSQASSHVEARVTTAPSQQAVGHYSDFSGYSSVNTARSDNGLRPPIKGLQPIELIISQNDTEANSQNTEMVEKMLEQSNDFLLSSDDSESSEEDRTPAGTLGSEESQGIDSSKVPQGSDKSGTIGSEKDNTQSSLKQKTSVRVQKLSSDSTGTKVPAKGSGSDSDKSHLSKKTSEKGKHTKNEVPEKTSKTEPDKNKGTNQSGTKVPEKVPTPKSSDSNGVKSSELGVNKLKGTKQDTEKGKPKGSDSDKTKTPAATGKELKGSVVPTKGPRSRSDQEKGSVIKGVKPSGNKTPVGKSTEGGTDTTKTKVPVLHDNKNTDSTFKSPHPVSGVKEKSTRTLTDSSGTDSPARTSSTKPQGVSVVDLTTVPGKPTADLKNKMGTSAGIESNKIPDQSSVSSNPDITQETVPRELRLSSSTDDDGQATKERKGPNIKYTKKKRMLSAHPWALPPTKIDDKGPWTCRLCTAGPLKTSSGTRRHYWQHYKIWTQSNDTYRDMTAEERQQHETTRTDARTQQRHVRRRGEIPAALGKVPDDSTTESSTSDSRNASGQLRRDSPNPPLSGLTPDSPGPSERKQTRPNQVGSDSKEIKRRQIINCPIKLSVPVRGSSESSERVEGMEIGARDDSEIESDFSEEAIVCLDDESGTKVKIEDMTANHIRSRINLETLKKLLLFGVEATLEQSKKSFWPPLTNLQEESLRVTYQTMLATVPIVRKLDKSMK